MSVQVSQEKSLNTVAPSVFQVRYIISAPCDAWLSVSIITQTFLPLSYEELCDYFGKKHNHGFWELCKALPGGIVILSTARSCIECVPFELQTTRGNGRVLSRKVT